MATIREEMLVVYYGGEPDQIPFAAYDFLIPRGQIERELRNDGMGLVKWCPVSTSVAPAFLNICLSKVQDVKISIEEAWESGEKIIIRTFYTPMGSVFEKYREDPMYSSKWIKKYLIESASDYPIVKFIVENSIIYQNYNSFLQVQDNLGDDGVVLALMDRSPLQKMMYEITGPERLFLDLYDNSDLVEDLLTCIEKKSNEMYKIAANSPAQVIWSPDNITEDMNSPSIFRKYCLPFYNKQGQLLHQQNKAYVVHMDGKLKCLKNSIKKADIDVVESFSLPEAGGNLPIKEASIAWKDKSIISNIPAFLCLKEEKTIREYIGQLLAWVYPRKNFMLQVSEDLPPQDWKRILPVVIDVMQKQKIHK